MLVSLLTFIVNLIIQGIIIIYWLPPSIKTKGTDKWELIACRSGGW